MPVELTVGQVKEEIKKASLAAKLEIIRVVVGENKMMHLEELQKQVQKCGAESTITTLHENVGWSSILK